MTNVDVALRLVVDGMTIGLGSGAASERFLRGLGARVRAGLKVAGVPTSNKIATMATELGIPLVELGSTLPLDFTFDGADEVDPHLNMIKGYGRALVREKIVAAASKKLVILIGPERIAEKRVGQLGSRGKLPIEVLSFAVKFVQHRLAKLGMPSEILSENGNPVLSDNGNPILHAIVKPIANVVGLDTILDEMPGVVGTGLFLGMADLVLVQDGDVVHKLRRTL